MVHEYPPKVGDNEKLDILANYLKKTPKIDTKTIQDLQKFSKAFGLVSSVMELVSKSLLKRSENFCFDILDKTLDLIPKENRDKILHEMLQNEISPYCLETLEFIMKKLENEECIEILKFLKNYQRDHL